MVRLNKLVLTKHWDSLSWTTSLSITPHTWVIACAGTQEAIELMEGASKSHCLHRQWQGNIFEGKYGSISSDTPAFLKQRQEANLAYLHCSVGITTFHVSETTLTLRPWVLHSSTRQAEAFFPPLLLWAANVAHNRAALSRFLVFFPCLFERKLRLVKPQSSQN